MKSLVRTLASLALILALTACGGSTAPADTTTAAEAVPTAPPLVLDAAYTIVRDEDSGASATAAGSALREALGEKPTLKTDWVKRDAAPVFGEYEILLGTTDFAQKAGKNGLPTSEKLADWTLDEIRQLRLKTNDGKQTDYLIPTMEEVLTTCRGRIWVRLDKLTAFDWARDIAPLIEKTGAYDTLIFNRQYTISQQRAYAADVRAKGGTPLLYQTAANGNDWRSMLDALAKLDIEPILWWTGYDKKNHTATLTAGHTSLDTVRGRARIYVDAQALGGAVETPQIWDELYAAGINFILVDDLLGVQQYIAGKYTPTS